MRSDLEQALDKFVVDYEVYKKGTLSAVLVLTRQFSQDALPINPENYKTPKKGQIKGLGGHNVDAILSEHGINKTLAKEGGRTSRGNMDILYAYANLINSAAESGPVDFASIEGYWVARVRAFFASKPLKLKSNNAMSMDSIVDDLIKQAHQREKYSRGATYAGTVLQDLVAAKLSIVVPDVEINGADVADSSTNRGGDFMVGDAAIHCTTAPGEALMRKCRQNIDDGLKPVIITVRDHASVARTLATDYQIADKIEVWDLQQFLSTNVYEHGLFESRERTAMMDQIIDAYNDIIDEYEGDPSLRISR